MAEKGVAIAAARLEAMRRLQAAVDARPEGLFPKPDILLDGELERRLSEGATAVDLEDWLIDDLARNRDRDAAAGRCLIGPHRTDLRVTHRSKAAPAADCSTGEQKALLIAIFLANARVLADDPTGPAPILLLDEAAAHLDADRRDALYDELAALRAQAWLTGVDRTLFETFEDQAQGFEIRDGSATPI